MINIFISDLHLSGHRPKLTALFQAFLAWLDQSQATLYILGDLFAAWIGDDAPDPAMTPVIVKLKQLSVNGHKIYIMHGNRDFLLSDHFFSATGCQLLADPSLILIHERKTLLCHGDTLCSDDIAYQQFRRQVRDPHFIQSFLSKTISERVAIAKHLREKSSEEVAGKAQYIMDVNEQAVEQLMHEFAVDRLIHGHTHRLAIHDITVDNHPAQRIVLGDWQDNRGNYLSFDKNQFNLRSFPSGEALV